MPKQTELEAAKANFEAAAKRLDAANRAETVKADVERTKLRKAGEVAEAARSAAFRASKVK